MPLGGSSDDACRWGAGWSSRPMVCDIASRAPAARQGSPHRCPEAHRRANLLRATSHVPRPMAAYFVKVELRFLVRSAACRARPPPLSKYALGSQGARSNDCHSGGCPGWPRGLESGTVALSYWPVGLMDKASAPGAGDSRFESWAGHSMRLHVGAAASTGSCKTPRRPVVARTGAPAPRAGLQWPTLTARRLESPPAQPDCTYAAVTPQS